MPTSHAEGPRLGLVRVHVHSPEEAAYLMSNFDETHNHSAGEIELLLWPGDRLELDKTGFHYEVITEDLVAHEDQDTAAELPIPMPGPDHQDYRRLADYNSEMKSLAKKNPKLVKLFKLKRPSLEGRKIFGIEIAADVKDTNDGRPIFYIDAVHHAREWPASEYTMIWLHHLVEKYGKDKKITGLLKKARVIAVPVVNVDGFHYSRESVDSSVQQTRNALAVPGGASGLGGYWRKNRRSLTEAIPDETANPDAYGVDPNRNYSYLWGDSNGGSSGNHADQTYRGAAPFSEPETQNVRDIILSRPVTAVLTNHTYQASVLRAGGGLAPEDGLLSKLGQKMATVLRYRNAGNVGYPTTGTTDDWAYASIGSIGYTIEHGALGFHPAYDAEIGSFWDEHMKAFDILFAAAASPKYHSVIKGKVSKGPATVKITKSFKTRLSPGNPTGKASIPEKINMAIKTNKNGSFVWHTAPSSRPYEKKAESFTLSITAGGKSKTMKVKVDRGQVKNLGKIKL